MKKLLGFALPFLAAMVASETPSMASDHVDGLKTAIDISADLTDMFTFTAPDDPNRLVLIMNVHGFAISRSRFSNAVDYKFRIRPIDDPKTLKPSTDARREQTITCSFSGGLLLIDPKQTATCTFGFSGGTETVSFDTRTDDYGAGGSTDQNGIKVFAGVRSDPWFLDLARTLAFNAGKKVDQTPGTNGLQGTNVLSIAVEFDKSKLGLTNLVAITAQTVRQ